MPTYARTRWNLADLFPGPDSQELEAATRELESLTADLEAARPSLAADIAPAAFVEILAKLDRIHQRKSRLQTYAALYFTEDTRNPAAPALRGRIEALIAGCANRLLFFELWWKTLPACDAGRLLTAAGPFRYWLERQRQLTPHTLSEPEERIINLKNATGSAALKTLYGAITNRQVFRVRVGGEEKELNRGEAINLMRHPDPDVRAATHRAQMQVFERDSGLLGPIYLSLARDWRSENMDLRGHASPISVRNLVNDVPDDVVATLLDVAHANRSVFQRFFRLKAQRLGTERLRRCDLLAPVIASNRTYPYEEATAFILDTFHRFDPLFGELAERVLAERHVDSEARPGKGFLCFCSDPNASATPFINMSYEGGLFDVLTLHHELGHAIHALLSRGNPALTRFPSLPLAETASIFSEMLLVEELLGRETDVAARGDLLFGQVDRLYTAIQRQVNTARFEMRGHDLAQQNATVGRLADAYLDGLRDQFGDSVDVPDEFRWEWLGIPHLFEYPFYVYAYAFGQLLVLALYRKYQEEGEAFKPGYISLLSAGGSASPMALLERAGIDARMPSFWQGGYDVVTGLVAELERMA